MNIDPIQEAKYWSNISDWANYIYITLGLLVIMASIVVFVSSSRAQSAKDIIIATAQRDAATAQQKAEEARVRQDELNIEVEKEKKLRAKAELALQLKIEEINNSRKPRVLSTSQRVKLIQSITRQTKCLVGIHSSILTDEGTAYSKQIIDALNEAGWQTKVSVRSYNAEHTGITLLVKDTQHLSDCAQSIIKAFSASGIALKIDGSSDIPYGDLALYFGNKPSI